MAVTPIRKVQVRFVGVSPEEAERRRRTLLQLLDERDGAEHDRRDGLLCESEQKKQFSQPGQTVVSRVDEEERARAPVELDTPLAGTRRS